MTDNHPSPDYSRPQFPAHHEPRVWVITAGDSPIGISVTRQILKHGDCALVGRAYSESDRDECRRDGFDAFLAEIESHSDEGWGQRFMAVPLDIRCARSILFASFTIRYGACLHSSRRMVGECQAVVAQAVATFGRVDILLCCTSQGTSANTPDLTSSASPANQLHSPHWYSGRASSFPTDLELGSGSVRDQLFRPLEHHQGDTSPYA